MVVPMGLENTQATFMQVIYNLFTNLQDYSFIMLLKNALVYSHTRNKHIQLLCMVFDKLDEHHFYCKLKKYSLFCTTTTFLGFDVTLKGLKISNAKMNGLCEWPRFTSMK